MSSTMVMAPIVSALLKTEDMLGKDRVWTPQHDEQHRFLEEFFAYRAELSHFSDEELRAWASWVAAELNTVLASEGFDIRLDDFAEGEFGVVSILDVLVEWLAEGTETEVRRAGSGMLFPAVEMQPSGEVDGQRETLFIGYFSSAHAHPIAQVNTKSGDRVYMTIADGAYEGFALINRINLFREGLGEPGRYDSLTFPMVDYNEQIDIGWLLGMSTITETGDSAVVSQAKQQTKFKMNQRGARVKSAVAIGVMTTAAMPPPLPTIVIDEPFFLWVERDGLATPVMYGYFDESDWSNPGDLSDL